MALEPNPIANTDIYAKNNDSPAKVGFLEKKMFFLLINTESSSLREQEG